MTRRGGFLPASNSGAQKLPSPEAQTDSDPSQSVGGAMPLRDHDDANDEEANAVLTGRLTLYVFSNDFGYCVI